MSEHRNWNRCYITVITMMVLLGHRGHIRYLHEQVLCVYQKNRQVGFSTQCLPCKAQWGLGILQVSVSQIVICGPLSARIRNIMQLEDFGVSIVPHGYQMITVPLSLHFPSREGKRGTEEVKGHVNHDEENKSISRSCLPLTCHQAGFITWLPSIHPWQRGIRVW